MKRIWIFMILIACPVMTLGQSSGSGSSGPPRRIDRLCRRLLPRSTAEVVGAMAAAQTPQGAALQGMSQVISAAGEYNLATSAAAINMTEAESNEMQNGVQGVQTFWQMRDIGRAEREKERGPRPTPEELARIARAGAPAP